MGILDDAIREHLELRRKHGASEAEISKKETEALSPARREAPVAVAEEPEPDEQGYDSAYTEGTALGELPVKDDPRPAAAEFDSTTRFKADPADRWREPLADDPLDTPPLSLSDDHAHAHAEAEPLAGSTELEPGPTGDESGPFVERIPPVEPPAEDVVMVDHVAPVEPPEVLEPPPGELDDPLGPEDPPLQDSVGPQPPVEEPRPRLRSALGSAFSRRADVESSTPLPPPSTQDFERVEPPAGDLDDFDDEPEPTTRFETVAAGEPELDLELDPEPMVDPYTEPEFVEEPLIQERPPLTPDPSSPIAASPQDEPDDDMLEDTPDFLQETPEHDRLWFEQKPPRDFDFDD